MLAARYGNLFLTLLNEEGRNLTRAVEDGRELPLDTLEIEPEGHFVLHELPPGKYRTGGWDKCGLRDLLWARRRSIWVEET